MNFSNFQRRGLLIGIWAVLLAETLLLVALWIDIKNLKGSENQISGEIKETEVASSTLAKLEKELSETFAGSSRVVPEHHGFSFKRISPEQQKVDRLKSTVAASAEHRETQFQNARLIAETLFGSLLSRLNLSADKYEKFINLLVDKAMVDSDINKSIQSQMGNMSMMELLEAEKRIVPAAKSEIESNIKALLGGEDFEIYENYSNHLFQNLLVGELQQTLFREKGTQILSEGQKDELVKIFSQNMTPAGDAKMALSPIPSGSKPAIVADMLNFQAVAPNGGTVDVFGSIISNYTITDDAINAAKSFLNRDQLTALEKIRERQIAERLLAAKFHF